MTTTVVSPRPTIIDAVFRWQGRVYQLAVVIAGSLLLALLAQLAIPPPFTPVPITGQTFGVLLVGALLGSRRGALSIGIYLVEGSVGLPFFTAGTSGWQTVVGPTGGYLLGFIPAAFAVGWLAERGWDRRFATAIVAMLVGEVVIYLAGLPRLGVFVGQGQALQLGLLPFIPGDIIKLLLAAAALPAAWKFVDPHRKVRDR